MAPCNDTETPLGTIRIVEESGKISRLSFLESPTLIRCQEPTELLVEASLQLAEYFAGTRTGFTLPLKLDSLSDFARNITQQLLAVPFGETVTYRELAIRAGHPDSARGVGRVMAQNRIPLFIPCHRVVGANGKMVGYSGGSGITTKIWLLEHERSC